MEKDPAKQKALIAQADELRDKALEIQKKQNAAAAGSGGTAPKKSGGGGD